VSLLLGEPVQLEQGQLGGSVESLDPAIYEKMRKGARFHIFKENWDQLVEVFGRGSTPPKIQYISLAYKSTFRQLPALIDYLLQERRGSIVEVRHTYDVPHIPQAFREAEYMSREDWLWLRDRLAHYTAEQVMLVLPPGVVGPAADSPVSGWSKHVGRYVRSFRRRSLFRAVPAEPPPSVPPKPSHGKLPRGFLARQYGFRLSWDGRLDVNAVWGDQDDLAPPVLCLLTTNVRDIGDIEVFLNTLPA